jgi:glycosyltransferase involved in cell wall biosynthesis
LKYLYDDLFLVLVGDGPDRRRLEKFSRSIRVHDRVRFAGIQPDISAWLSAADIVWIPTAPVGGANAALEAMAAARPVIAAKTPDLADIVSDGETGIFFPPADKVTLARQTHFLLQNDDQRRQLGNAARQRASEHFAVPAMVQAHASTYTARAA